MKCPLLVSLASDVYALKALSQHRQGNIIMSAWHKLGYVSAEELAKLRFDGDMDAFAASMSHVQGSMRTLLNLDVLPDLGLDAAAKDLDSSILATALQAKRHVWWIHDEADRCLPLPSWTNRPLELVIMAWVKERQGWDRLLQERGDKGLTAQQQAKYAAWSGKPQRDVLLDMELQMGASQTPRPKRASLCSASPSPWSRRPVPELLETRQYVEAEAHPEASVIPGCVQIKPPEVLEPELAEEVEENDDAAVLAPDNGLPPSDAPVAGGPKLKHGSEEYKHLLPDREGGIVALHGVVPIAFLHSKPKLPHELSGREA